MFGWYPTVDPQRNLASTVSRMRKSLSPTAPVSAIQATNSTRRPHSGSSDISYDINTGALSRWFRPASRSPRPETSPGRSSGTGASASRSSASDMRILHEIWTLSSENPDSKTPIIARPVLPWICATLTTENSHVYGWKNNKMWLEPLEQPTLGLSITA